jgi:hypothetical protein
MPMFGNDIRSEFRVSSAEWHERAFHNRSRHIHQTRLQIAKSHGFDVEAIQTAVPTGKTCSVAAYCAHLDYVLRWYDQLHQHYRGERESRWSTYRKSMGALHELCMRVKGDPELRREQVVVAYGAGQFGSTMKGKRPVPVKKFRKHLMRYVTVVMVDEFRTSRVCSKLCFMEEEGDNASESGNEEEEEERVLMDEEEGVLMDEEGDEEGVVMDEEEEGSLDEEGAREVREREEEEAAHARWVHELYFKGFPYAVC